MSRHPQEIAARLLRRNFEELSELERGVVGRVGDRRHVSRDVNREFEGQLTLGQRLADRMAAEHDYEVNLKAELEVMGLHEKLDGLREQQWAELIELQRRQLALLERIVAERGSDGRSREGA